MEVAEPLGTPLGLAQRKYRSWKPTPSQTISLVLSDGSGVWSTSTGSLAAPLTSHKGPVLFFSSLVVFLAAGGLYCCSLAFSGCGQWGLFSGWGARASHGGGFSAVELGLQGTRASAVAAPRLVSTGSELVVHRPNCSAACGILCLLHWQVHS